MMEEPAKVVVVVVGDSSDLDGSGRQGVASLARL